MAFTEEPRGVPGAELDAGQRQQLRDPLATYTDRVPEGARRTWDDEELDEVHVAWAGSLADGAPATTGSRGHDCWWSGTTPSAMPTTPTRCGATPSTTSAWTCSPTTDAASTDAVPAPHR